MENQFYYKLLKIEIMGKSATEVKMKIGKNQNWITNSTHFSEDTLNNTINGLKKFYNAVCVVEA